MTDTITLPSDLVEHCATELKHQCGGRCNAEYNPCWAIELSDKLRSALAQQAEQGWVRVPVEPTQEMINAGRTTPMPSDSEFDEDEDYRAVFIAMVAAAPKGGV